MRGNQAVYRREYYSLYGFERTHYTRITLDKLYPQRRLIKYRNLMKITCDISIYLACVFVSYSSLWGHEVWNNECKVMRSAVASGASSKTNFSNEHSYRYSDKQVVGGMVYAAWKYKTRVMDGHNTKHVSVWDKFQKHSIPSKCSFNEFYSFCIEDKWA
jgi:hypothetical protein